MQFSLMIKIIYDQQFEETKAETSNLFGDILEKLRRPKLTKLYKKISYVSHIDWFVILKLMVHLEIREI